ncbi:hypothetical protein L0152_26105, partial [bacterium]|nr:hypothetical protein [bacterium]
MRSLIAVCIAGVSPVKQDVITEIRKARKSQNIFSVFSAFSVSVIKSLIPPRRRYKSQMKRLLVFLLFFSATQLHSAITPEILINHRVAEKLQLHQGD